MQVIDYHGRPTYLRATLINRPCCADCDAFAELRRQAIALNQWDYVNYIERLMGQCPNRAGREPQ